MSIGGILNVQSSCLHKDHLDPLTNGATSPGHHSRIFFMPMVLWPFFIKRCITILVPNLGFFIGATNNKSSFISFSNVHYNFSNASMISSS